MSTQALAPSTGAVAGGPADAIAATRRMQRLQALIAQAGQGGSPASFAAALDAASAETSGTAPAEAGGASATEAGGTGSAPPSGASAASAIDAAIGIGANGALAPAATASNVASLTPAGAGATPSASASAATPYDGAIAQAAARYNLDPAVLHGLIQQESGFDPNSRSSAGALGLTQLMPGTASSLGVSNPLDPVQSIEGGARYLSEMMSQFGGNTADALAAYNAGPGAVRQYGGVPPYAETQAYVSKVLGYADAYRSAQPAASAYPATTAAPSAYPLAPSSTAPASPTGSIA